MDNALAKSVSNLPATMEELTKFVLVGREKLTSVRAEIRAIDKLQLAEEVREQKKEEAQILAEALLDAEMRIGELLKETAGSSRSDLGTFEKTLPDRITKNQSSAFQRMATHKEIVERVKAASREKDELPTRTAVLNAIKKADALFLERYRHKSEPPAPEKPADEPEPEPTSRPHIANNSGNNEWYTPAEIIESARKVLLRIDLDPASCEKANEIVKAKQFYTIEDNGLEKPWSGNIWLNPPYSADLIPKFIDKLEAERKNIRAAIVLVNNATETQWFMKLVRMSEAICFPVGRVKYWGPEGEKNTPLQGQAIAYIGPASIDFTLEFAVHGWIATFGLYKATAR